MNDYFKVMITKDDVKFKKPNPEVYLKIINDLKIKDLSTCIVVEDSLSGVQAGKQAGLKVIGIFDEYSSKDKKDIMKLTEYYADNYKELMNIFTKKEGE